MKKCPICGTMSSEKDTVCGVCGTGLTHLELLPETPQSMEHALTGTLPTRAKARRGDRRTQGTLGILVGLGMVATGILIIQFIALFGILLLLFGFTVIATDVSWMRGDTFYDQDEPIIHGRASLHGIAVGSFGSGIREEPSSSGSSSEEKNENE